MIAEPGFRASHLGSELSYYLFSFLCVCLWRISVVVCMSYCTCVSVHIYVPLCTHLEARGEPWVSSWIICCLTFFETGSLTKPRVKLAGSKPRQSSCVGSSAVLGLQLCGEPLLAFYRGPGCLNPGPSCLHSKFSYPLSHLSGPYSCVLNLLVHRRNV